MKNIPSSILNLNTIKTMTSSKFFWNTDNTDDMDFHGLFLKNQFRANLSNLCHPCYFSKKQKL